MSINDTITSGRRKTGGFASRLLHKAMAERDKKNSLELQRPTIQSNVAETEIQEENKLASVSSVSD